MMALFLAHTALSLSSISQTADQYLQNLVAQNQFSGSVLMVDKGSIILDKGYGYANLEHTVANMPHTKFRIRSITKPFTATLIMQLQEKGLLNVTNSLSKYIPDYPHGNTITIAHLLSHTSGIFNLSNVPDIETLLKSPATIQQVIETFKDKPSEFQPGQKFKYSNSNFMLLSYIIEQVSGKPYAEVLQENILNPLGMKNSGYYTHSEILQNNACGYVLNDGTLINAPYYDSSWPLGNGGMYSTTHDLYLLDRALYTNELLSKNSRDQMFAIHAHMPDEEGIDYGYGWELGAIHGKKYVSHWGIWAGFTSDFLRFPDDDLVIIVLSNFEHAHVRKISRDLAGIVLQEGTPPR